MKRFTAILLACLLVCMSMFGAMAEGLELTGDEILSVPPELAVPEDEEFIIGEAEPAQEQAVMAVEDDFVIKGGVLVSYCGDGGDVVIPDGVTSIGDWVFEDQGSLTSVSIPNSVTSIGEGAFCYCTNLTSVTIPNGVTSISNHAFEQCNSLTSVVIPNSVTSIGECAFMYCWSLTNVAIPNSVTSIGDYAFCCCTILTSVTIPNSVTSLGICPFGDCIALTDVTIENGNITIDDSVFGDQVTSITFHTPCESKVMEWAQGKGFKVVKDHKAVTDPAVAATTAKTGLTEGSHCSECGEVLVGQEVVPRLISLSECKITVKDAVTYNGKALTPTVTVNYNGRKLKKGTDYTVSYKNNTNVGKATVTVKGMDTYGGSVKKTFRINPAKVSGLKLQTGKQQITVSWKKGGGKITGYEIQYAADSKFKTAKTVTVNKAATVKKTIKKLEAGKTYYVRIRAYKKGGYTSAWSKAKKIKIKAK